MDEGGICANREAVSKPNRCRCNEILLEEHNNEKKLMNHVCLLNRAKLSCKIKKWHARYLYLSASIRIQRVFYDNRNGKV